VKDKDIRSAGKQSNLIDLDSLNESQLDRYVETRVSIWLDKAREHRSRVQALTKRREKAMSAGRWTADSAETSKVVQEEINLLRETEETERKALEFREFYEKRTGRRIRLPPGHGLIDLSRHILSEATYKRYVYPHIADMHSEYFPALQAGDLRRARMIEAAFYIRVFWPVIKALFLSFKTLFEFANK